MPQDEAILLDIAEAARLVLAFKRGMTKDAFLDDLKTQSAVLHQLSFPRSPHSGMGNERFRGF